MLGAEPTAQDFSGGRLKLTWLSLRFQELPDDVEEATVQHYARAYIMQLIGGLVFPDKSQNLVKLMYLPFLRDFDQAGRYSGGAAALATLYRMMCRATRTDTRDIGGVLVLLQVWGRYRKCYMFMTS